MNEFDESVVNRLLELTKIVRTQIQKGSFETLEREYAEIDVMSDVNFDKKERRPNVLKNTQKFKQLSLARSLDQLKDWAKQLDIYKAAAQEIVDAYAIAIDQLFVIGSPRCKYPIHPSRRNDTRRAFFGLQVKIAII